MSVAERERLSELASLHALGVLTAEEHAELARAATRDPSLAAEIRALEDTVVALGGIVPPAEPPADLRARVLASIGGAAPSTAVPSTASSSMRQPLPARGATGSRALPGWLAAAAALILAGGLGIYALQLRGELGRVEGRLASAEREMTRLMNVIGTSEDRIRILQAQADVLFAPDMARIDLQGQAAAPGASARAFWSRRSGMTFAARNLPPLPAGKAYQVWVVPQGAPPVSAGLLDPATGNETQFFKTPEDVPAPAAVAVTLEPAGGVPQPTGDQVLVGLVGN
jgi:anti-sigma-K factor RskA